MPCDITFRGKIESVYNPDDSLAWRYIKIPKIERRHCDMESFRRDSRFGGYVNSDLFGALLSRQFKERGIKETIRLDKIPDCVAIDESGFLARVTISL